jgi:hypothetical protein
MKIKQIEMLKITNGLARHTYVCVVVGACKLRKFARFAPTQ